MASKGKIKHNEIAKYRSQYAKRQGQRCALCRERVRLADRALDHDHATGHLRGVLHRDCNILLGKIENYISRQGKALKESGRIHTALRNISEYMGTDYSSNPLHPKHRTEFDKLVRTYRANLRKAKRPETKRKWREKIAAVRRQEKLNER